MHWRKNLISILVTVCLCVMLARFAGPKLHRLPFMPATSSDKALIQAVEAKNLQMVKAAIADGADVDYQVPIPVDSCIPGGTLTSLSTPLILSLEPSPGAMAHRRGKPKEYKIAYYLLEHGADPNLPDEFGETALHEAAMIGNVHLLSVLLDKGANPNLHGLHRNTPFFDACWLSDLDEARLLSRKGADVNWKDESGSTALHQTVQRSYSLPLAKWLVGTGADINTQNKDGETPLHWAARSGNVDAVKLLVDAGANRALKDRNGKTPLDLARAYRPSRDAWSTFRYSPAELNLTREHLTKALESTPAALPSHA